MKIRKTLLMLLLIISCLLFFGCNSSSNSPAVSTTDTNSTPIIFNSIADWEKVTFSWNAVPNARGYLIFVSFTPNGNYICINQTLSKNILPPLLLNNLPSLNDWVNKGWLIPITETMYSIQLNDSVGSTPSTTPTPTYYYKPELSNNFVAAGSGIPTYYYGQELSIKILALSNISPNNIIGPPTRVSFKNDGHIGTWYCTSENGTSPTNKYVYTFNPDRTYTYRVYTWNNTSVPQGWNTDAISGDSGTYRIEYSNINYRLYFTKLKTISEYIESNIGTICEESHIFNLKAQNDAPYYLSIDSVNYYYNTIAYKSIK